MHLVWLRPGFADLFWIGIRFLPSDWIVYQVHSSDLVPVDRTWPEFHPDYPLLFLQTRYPDVFLLRTADHPAVDVPDLDFGPQEIPDFC